MIFQGEEGVREVLQILNDEFRLSMALSGESQKLGQVTETGYRPQCDHANISVPK